jgi:hypothetical protein
VTTSPLHNIISPLLGTTEKNIGWHLESWRFSVGRSGRIIVEEEVRLSSVMAFAQDQ